MSQFRLIIFHFEAVKNLILRSPPMKSYDRLKIGDALAINFLTACGVKKDIEILFSVSQTVKTYTTEEDDLDLIKIYRTNNAMDVVGSYYYRLKSKVLDSEYNKDYRNLMETYKSYSKEASIYFSERNERFSKDKDVNDLYEEIMQTKDRYIETDIDGIVVRFIELNDVESDVSLIEPVYKYKLESMPTILICDGRWLPISYQSSIYMRWKEIADFTNFTYTVN